MQTIFVEVKCALGESYRVAEALVDISGVSEVYSISGSYDLLIKCYLATDEDIGHFVNERIQKVAGITGTMTTIAFNAFS
jgi:DNA-binding Lrp family transcriptional regulator